MSTVQERITERLLATKREGMERLLHYLVGGGFFESPASTRFHGCYKGGLAAHSLQVFEMLADLNVLCQPNAGGGVGQKALPVTVDSIAVATLLHDVCKIGAYLGDTMPYTWNRAQPKGHALLSLVRIMGFIKLTPLEEMMITYHMGVYGLNEFFGEKDRAKGEYPLRGDHTKSKEERYGASLANAWYHNPIVKFMYFCDELSTLAERGEGERALTFAVERTA